MTAISRTSRDKSSIQRVLIALLLVAGAFLSALTVPNWNGFFALALFGGSLLLSLCFFRRANGSLGADALIVPSVLLGFLIPLINAYGSATLLSVTLLYVAFAVFFIDFSLVWALPWVGVLFFSAGAEIFWSASLVDWGLRSVSWNGITETLVAWHHFSPEWLRALIASFRWLALCSLIVVFSHQRNLARAVVRGFAVGAFVAIITLLYDYSIGRHSHIPAQELFWAGIGRFSGTFSDANAFGIVALLSVAFVSGKLFSDNSLSERRWRMGSIFLLILAAILLSGSRSLLLGMFVIAAMRAPLSRRTWVVLLTFVLVSYLIFARTPLTSFEPLLSRAPESIERVIRSVHPETASEALTSRWMFVRIGQRMWRDNPWWGVGLNRFPEYVPEYAKREGIVIGRWLDNSNNFYLGTLAEMGIVGFLALVLSAAAIRFVPRNTEVVWSRTVLVAFLFVLLVGPHLDFDEVAIMFALVVAGAGVSFSEGIDRRLLVGSMTVILPLIIAARASNSYGLFPFEFSTSGPFRWSETAARFSVTCDQNGQYPFSYVKPVAIVPTDGMIDLWVNGEHSRRPAPPGQRQNVMLECVKIPPFNRSVPLHLKLHSPGYFVPAETGATGDLRRLSLQLLFPPD